MTCAWCGLQIEADSVFKHAVNAVLLQIELWISSFPWTVPWVVFPTAYILIYAIYMWIWYAADDSWVYDSLDFGKSSAPIMYFAVSMLVLFAFSICWLGAWSREKIAKRRGPAASVMADVLRKQARADHQVELGTVPQ